MVEKLQYSFRARAELAAYQVLAGATALLGAGSVPVLRRYFNRIDEGFSDYLGTVKKPPKVPSIWVHGVSMGESLVAIGFASELRRLFPQMSLVFTSTHPDVIKNVKKRQIADVVAYFPLDTLVTMGRAFERFRPAAVFVAETDFWPIFSHNCARRGVPLMLVNGRISSKIAEFYRHAAGLAEVVFGAFTLFVVQTRLDRERLENIGVSPDKIKVVGNVKADLSGMGKPADLASVKKWQGTRRLVVFGSLHPAEFAMLLPVFKKLAAKNVAVLVAPRNIALIDEWQRVLIDAGLGAARRSAQSNEGSEPFMLLDTMGELASAYSLADAAVVGGSIDVKVGGHNPLEVMEQRVPLLLGPNTRNFADVVEQLQVEDGVRICSDADQFLAGIEGFLNNPGLAATTAERAFQVLQKNRGALAATLELAKKLIRR
ncbi:MAG: 3-deoxy-D-manno-octulosonic acid transferase [Candidatus Rifleibacteriota bacterium]